MKKKILLTGIVFLSLLSCRTQFHLVDTRPLKNTVIGENLREDPTLQAVISPYKSQMDSRMNAKISHTAVELSKQGDNSNLGNLLADFTLQGAQEWALKNNIPAVDAAIINIGGIRSTIGQGDIYLKSIYEVMPFENEVVIIKMSGYQLRDLFDYYAKNEKNNPVAGLYIETEKNRLLKGLIGGKPVEDGRTYYIATSDYLALGGDDMKFFRHGEMIQTGIKLRDLFVNKFRDNPEIKAAADTRLIFRNKKPTP